MTRKILAILCSLLTLYVLKETYYIFTTADAEIAKQRNQLILVSLSIVIPLIVLSLWLWRPKPKQAD
ncbi:hypothetical protein [Pedobacter sp. ASV12]|uniref:hypothetical protein n=1 Tax=Pedobacter sp. ASV12 TaxID=2795120 RepID=UPI0018ED79FA|nr:hypothetical protein [Pedobacter sp. ASV12]